ncbi:VOC family protein [Isoptericola sp. NPDC055881]
MHPRLLVRRFAACFRFYDAVLPPLTGARLVRGTHEGPYASWDIGSEGAVMLLDRTAMASITGTAEQPAELPAGLPPHDAAMLVSRVDDVAAGYALCLAHGAAPVAPPAPRPQWGPTMRTAHVRDPDGNLWELQSY